MIAWLLPLCGFAVEIFAGFWGSRKSKTAAYIAVGCIGTAFVCSLSALLIWGFSSEWAAVKAVAGHHAAAPVDANHGDHAAEHAEGGHHPGDDHAAATVSPQAAAAMGPFTNTIYTLATFGSLRVAIDYYIDSLTLVMFTMVTFIATCIHLFAMGYMSDELTENYEDHQVHTSHGHFHRPGRFYRFFAFLSLFCFSMLGLEIGRAHV